MDNMCSVCKRECKDLFVKCHCKRKVQFDCLPSSYIPEERGNVSTSKYAVYDIICVKKIVRFYYS